MSNGSTGDDADVQARPRKRVALFLDGTWNVVSDNTNVWRLRSLFQSKSTDGAEQRAYYSTGLGTKFGERLSGGMFGRGILTAITSAYEWLVDNYEPDDEIFIFGFSRGAYTARSLSGFVSKCGLLERGSPLGVNQLFLRYRRPRMRTIRELIAGQDKTKNTYSFEENWMLRYARPVEIKYLGVFDTVGALGVPFQLFNKFRGVAYPFLNTGLRQNNEYAFHALAIDEHRRAFAPTLWTNAGATEAAPRPLERTEQRWFIGAHANVGGGCLDDPLAQLPCAWLARKAINLGLNIGGDLSPEPNAHAAAVSDSYSEFMYGAYRVIKLFQRDHRAVGEQPIREGPAVRTINETIDASVFERWRADPEYRPASLGRWANKRKIDPACIMSSVRADDHTVAVPD